MTETTAFILSDRARARAQYPHPRMVGAQLFVSGLSSRRPDDTHEGVSVSESGEIVKDIRKQTRACLENLRTILNAAGLGLEHAVDVTCFLVSMSDYKGFNEVYNQYFTAKDGPTRTTVAVAQLPHPDLLVELKAIAYVPARSVKSTEGREVLDEEPARSTEAGEVSLEKSEKSTEGREVLDEEPARSTEGREVSFDELPAIEVVSLLAENLWEAEQNQTMCAAPTKSHPNLEVSTAYAIQRHNIERRLARGSTRCVGYKIGITSVAVQRWLGVLEPDFGHLLSDMVVDDGGTIETKTLLQPRAEGELAFVLRAPLKGPGVTAADVIAATDYLLPAVEVIDSRVVDWKITYVDTIADNASSARFVLGTQPIALSAIDPRLIGMVLRKNGRVASTGAGAASLNSPINAVCWLANKFGELGLTLERGAIILAGALGPVVEVVAGDRVEVQIGSSNKVGVRFV